MLICSSLFFYIQNGLDIPSVPTDSVSSVLAWVVGGLVVMLGLFVRHHLKVVQSFVDERKEMQKQLVTKYEEHSNVMAQFLRDAGEKDAVQKAIISQYNSAIPYLRKIIKIGSDE